ncbi:MAG TPA: hypothetical protein VL096_05645 [Pirellulaceae bacterium]|nr:hypothetical protein [Pirellulaceae bacterium]
MEQSTCPDCSGQLCNIKLLDATEATRAGEGVGHVELTYAAPDAAATFFTRAVTKSGVVKAKLCNQCGRIFLYASRPTLGSQ